MFSQRLIRDTSRIARSNGVRLNIRSNKIRSFHFSPIQRFEQKSVNFQAIPHDTPPTAFNPNPPPAPVPERGESEPIRSIQDEGSDVQLQLYPTSIALVAPSLGISTPFHFDHVWLRDVCEHPSSVEPASKQKLFHTSDISLEGGMVDENSVKIVGSDVEIAFNPQHAVTNAFSATFSSAPTPSTKPHVTKIPIQKLLNHATSSYYMRSHGDIGGVLRPWISSDMTTFPYSQKPPAKSENVKPGQALDKEGAFARPARLTWSSLLPESESEIKDATSLSPSELSRFALVDGLMKDGIAFVTGVPTDKTGDSILASDPTSANLARLAEMLGEIRNTFYGSLWNVRSLGSSSRNIAYTNLDLGLHMDLCYFQNPPRFQFLHMLRNRVQGGQSIFVDSFAIAEKIYKMDKNVWKCLTEVPVCFEYQNDQRHYRYCHPTFEVARPNTGHAGLSLMGQQMPRLTAINYSPPFQGNLPLRWPVEQQDGKMIMVDASPAKRMEFYQALQLFAKLTHDPEFRYERMLQEGECVIFDNRRVLHSRRGFEWDEKVEEKEDEVKRWLKGCYVDGDAIWSTYRTLLAKSRGGSLSNE